MTFVPVAVGVILWKNSEWALEIRSLKALCYQGFDGFLAPVLFIATFPVARAAGGLAARFEVCESIYAELLIFTALLVFSIALSISAFRQRSLAGKVCATLTLFSILLTVPPQSFRPGPLERPRSSDTAASPSHSYGSLRPPGAN